MKKILLGFLCLFIDVTLVVCLQHFGFVLPIVGILYLCFGFLELEQENENFVRSIYYALAIAGIRVFLFGLQCFNSDFLKGSVGAVVAILPCLFLCYMLNHTVFCFSDISYEQSVLLPLSQNLFTANLCCLANTATIFLSLFSVPLIINISISITSNLLATISLCFLAKRYFDFSKNVKYEML